MPRRARRGRRPSRPGAPTAASPPASASSPLSPPPQEGEPTSPMVLLVVGGGFGTLKTVQSSLTAENGAAAGAWLCGPSGWRRQAAPALGPLGPGASGARRPLAAQLPTWPAPGVRTGSEACPVVVVAEAKGAGQYIYEVLEEGVTPKEVRAKEPARICPAPREAPRRSRADVAPPATPSQAARRWKAGEAEDRKSGIYASDAPEQELVAVLESILELSKIKLRHSANQDFPVKFFRTDRDENNDLREVILNAILDDSRSTDQAIRLAVEWGDAKITRHQLQASLTSAPTPRLHPAPAPPPCASAPRLRPAPPPLPVRPPTL